MRRRLLQFALVVFSCMFLLLVAEVVEQTSILRGDTSTEFIEKKYDTHISGSDDTSEQATEPSFSTSSHANTADANVVRAEPPPHLTLDEYPRRVVQPPTTNHVFLADNIAPTSTPAKDGGDQELIPEFIRERTNIERGLLGLPPLRHSDILSKMALTKAEDMIAKQYFAHVSPSGVDIALLAKTAGYAYLNIGENLALGDFTSSEHVVTGWMNSPGHRANILNKEYTEIGIAATLGRYEGDLVWFAVQEFGRPLSDCPSPDELLEKKIEIYNEQLAKLEITLENLQHELENGGYSKEDYNVKANDYNTIAALYNSLLPTVRIAIDTYNTQAKAFNECTKVSG